MLLCVDIGNTNIVIGVYRGDELLTHWRLSTDYDKMPDEYGLMLLGLLQHSDLRPADIRGVVVASVVPPVTDLLTEMIDLSAMTPWVVGAGVKTRRGHPLRGPRDLGAEAWSTPPRPTATMAAVLRGGFRHRHHPYAYVRQRRISRCGPSRRAFASAPTPCSPAPPSCRHRPAAPHHAIGATRRRPALRHPVWLRGPHRGHDRPLSRRTGRRHARHRSAACPRSSPPRPTDPDRSLSDPKGRAHDLGDERRSSKILEHPRSILASPRLRGLKGGGPSTSRCRPAPSGRGHDAGLHPVRSRRCLSRHHSSPVSVEMFQLLRDVRWPTSPSRRADLIVVAPATAKPSASAHGLADTC